MSITAYVENKNTITAIKSWPATAPFSTGCWLIHREDAGIARNNACAPLLAAGVHMNLAVPTSSPISANNQLRRGRLPRPTRGV